MIRFVLIRILWLIPVIIAVSFIVFSLMELAPGNLIDAVQSEDMTPEVREELIRRHNLDRPMIYRYGLYMLNLLRGDLGVSEQTGASVWYMFITRLPNTLILSLVALVIGVVVAIPIGMIAARRAGTLVDNAVTVFALLGMSMPLFWLGLLLILLFALQLQLFPAAAFDHGARSIVLPAVVSSFTLMANAARQTRSNMLEVLKADYLRTARAKGTPEKLVIRRHALGNAWIPIITAVGSALSVQLAGSVVVESVFAWPGIGRLAAEAVRARDVTTATGVVIMTSILYVLVQLVVDLLYAFVDPRIKAQYTSNSRRKKHVAAKSGSKSPVAAAKVSMPEVVMAVADVSSQPDEIKEPDGNTSTAQAPVVANAALEETHAKNVAAVKAVKEPSENQKSFATRDYSKGIQIDFNKSKADSAAELVSKKYKKRSQIGEIFHSLRRNKGAMVGFFIFCALLLTFIASLFISWEAVTAMSARNRLLSPSWQFPFGTDNFGRDMFLRVIFGTRYTLAIGFGVVTFGAIFGVTLGSIAGYFGGKVDDIIMRASDVLASIPGILLGMVIVTVLGPSLQNLIIAVGVQAIPIYLRMTRASVMTVRHNEFVEASRAIGLSNFRIIFTQVLPNGLSPIIVTLTASMGISIIVASSLSYLGFGIPVPHPEWGALIAVTSEFARAAPYLLTFPGLFIMITVLAFNMIGDGLRDALDPKLKK